MEKTRTSGMSIAALVCGIGGLVIPWLGFILAVLGIIFGAVSIRQIGADPTLGGRGMAIAGLVCGIVAIALWVILIVWVGVFSFWSVPYY